MPEIPESGGWHSSDGRDRPTPELRAYAERIGGKIVTLTIRLPIRRTPTDSDNEPEEGQEP